MSAEVKFEPLSFDDVKSRLAGPEDKASPRTLVVFAGADLAFGAAAKGLLAGAADQIARAAAYAKFTGKSGSALEILAPAGLPGASRLLLLGTAAAAGDGAQTEKPKTSDAKTPDAKTPDAKTPDDFLTLGGQAMGKIGAGANALVLFDPSRTPADAGAAAGQFALGAVLRAYKFDQVQDQEEEGRRGARRRQRDRLRRRRCRGRAVGAGGGRGSRRQRAAGAHAGQRAGQCADAP